MSDAIPIHNYTGETVFHILTPSGCCIGRRGEIDPRRGITEDDVHGDFFLDPRGVARGLNGERISYFKVGGGDTVRLVEVLDGETVKEKWWELYETRSQPHPLKNPAPIRRELWGAR